MTESCSKDSLMYGSFYTVYINTRRVIVMKTFAYRTRIVTASKDAYHVFIFHGSVIYRAERC